MKLVLEVIKYCDRILKFFVKIVEKKGDKKDIFLFFLRNFDKFRFVFYFKKEKYVLK